MVSSKKQVKTGISLKSFCSVSAYPKFCHNETHEWEIRSNVDPLDASFLDSTVLNCILPGKLGFYFYPVDAVFYAKHEKTTTKEKYNSVLREETLRCSSIPSFLTNNLSVEKEDEVMEPVDESSSDSMSEEDEEEMAEFIPEAQEDEENPDADL
jgi:hypothetical protein